MCNRLHTYRRVKDGQTDRQTSCYGIFRAMHTRRAVKKCILAISVKGGRGIRALWLSCTQAYRRCKIWRQGRTAALKTASLLQLLVPRIRHGAAASMCTMCTTIRSKYWSLRHWTQTVCLTPVSRCSAEWGKQKLLAIWSSEPSNFQYQLRNWRLLCTSVYDGFPPNPPDLTP